MAKAFTNAELKEFRKDFAIAVIELESKYGVNIELGNISYSSTQFTGKVTVWKDGVSKFQEQAEYFKQVYKLYGLEEDMLGKTFNAQGYELEFVGVDHKKPKYPCICAVSNNYNKTFKLSVSQLKYYLKA